MAKKISVICITFVLLWMVCITTQTCSWTKKRCAKVVNRLKKNSCAYEYKPSGTFRNLYF